jgi:hypothetical protein
MARQLNVDRNRFLYVATCMFLWTSRYIVVGVAEADIGQRNAQRRGECNCFELYLLTIFLLLIRVQFHTHLSRLGPDRNGFRDRMFGRESYPPPPPPFFRDRMMGRFGVRVSFWNMKHFCHVVGLERGPLSLVSTTEELLDRKKRLLSRKPRIRP